MKKTVLKFGLISGAIAAALLLAQVPFMDGSNRSLVVGYTAMVLSGLMIFFGVHQYREEVGHGKISFGRGFAVGILIALISAAAYVATWEVVYYSSPGIADHVFDQQVEQLKAKGAAQAEIDAAAAEAESFKKLYSNPLVNVAFTFVEPFPVGLIMTLVAAAVLRRR